MQINSPGVFKFTHRTFLEYFFAKRIEEEAGSVGALINAHLLDKIIKSQWDVVNHLALQIATFRSGPKSTQAVETLLKIGKEAHFAPPEEVNFLNFFAHALEYLLVPELRLSQAIDHIFRRCIHLGGNFSLSVGSIIGDVLEATQKRASISQEAMRLIANPILSGQPTPERTYLLYVLGMRFSGHMVLKHGLRYSRIVWQSFQQIRNDCQLAQLERAKEDVVEARSYYYVYGDRFGELFSIHGIKLLFSVPSGLVPFEVSHLGYLAVHEAVRLRSSYAGPRFYDLEIPKADALLVLNELSEILYRAWQEGNVGELIPATSENGKFPILDELAYYVAYVSRRRMPVSLRQAVTRAAFLYIVLGDGHNDREQFERVLRSKRVRRLPNPDSLPLLELSDDKFSQAIAQIGSNFVAIPLKSPP